MLDNPAAASLFGECDAAEISALRETFATGLSGYTEGEDRPVLLKAACNLLTARRSA